MSKNFISIASLCIVCFSFVVSAIVLPVKFGELKKQVEINSKSDKSYREDIKEFHIKLNTMIEEQKEMLIELKTLKTYIRTKEGKSLE